MKSLWNMDSPVMRRLTCCANLVGLNLLWLLTCLPVITIGAATAALYYTVFQYHTGETDELLRPYFCALRKNLKQGTCLWMVMLLVGSVLAFDALYLYGRFGGQFHAMWIPILVMAVVLVFAVTYTFPQIGRFNNFDGQIIKNAFYLTVLHPLQSLAMATLNAFPLVLLVFAPQKFFATLIGWMLLGFSLTAYLNSFLLLKLFESHRTCEKRTQEERM